MAFHHASLYPKLVNLSSWADGLHAALPLWISPAAGSSMDWGRRALLLQNQASEETGQLPQGCMSLSPPWPSEKEHPEDVWVSYSIGGAWDCGPEAQAGLHLWGGRTPLVYRGPYVSGRYLLLCRLFGWSCLLLSSISFGQGSGMVLDGTGFTALTTCAGGELWKGRSEPWSRDMDCF